MTKTVTFTLDGREVIAQEGETIWQVAKREGIAIPHLCHLDQPGYRPDGNCRACVCEIEGERTLAASCIRKPTDGLVVKTTGERTEKARAMVFELLATDMPRREASPDPQSKFWNWSDKVGVETSRFPGRNPHAHTATPHEAGLALHDASHTAIAVNLDACIACGLCERACREVQSNDVIGMGFRGHDMRPVFDLADEMGDSTCVACGECVQACPTGALLEKSLMDESATQAVLTPDREVNSVCPYCGVGCQTRVAVKDDRIIRVDGRDGPANENRLCVKGRFGYDYVRHPHRLTRPLIRREGAPKRGDMTLDPMNPWEIFREATWEEAMAVAARGLGTIRDRDGSDAFAGFGSAKGSNEEAYLFQKFVRVGFGTNNVDHCTRLCHASSVAALMEGVGSGAVSAPFSAALDADCILIIGARPEQNHPVAATYFKRAAKNGATLIIADPRGQGLMRYATHGLKFRPGTDVALLNAMLHTIIEEGLTDEQFIQARASGFEELKAKVKQFSPEAMAPVCGIPAETIREVARTFATSERSIIFWGMGVSQHVHGTDNSRCLIALSVITGQIGRPGTGLHPLRGQNNVQGASDAGLIPMMYPDYRSVENPDIRGQYEDVWGRALDPKRGLTVVEIMDAIHAGSIKGMYVMGENPAMSDPDQIHAREALAKLECLVVQDIFLTETAWHADVIFPSSAHAEKLGTFTNTNRQVQLGRPVLPLPGEARQDWELIVELGQRLGMDWSYADVGAVYEEMRANMPSLSGIPWSRLLAEDCVTYPADGPTEPGRAIIFEDSFPTKDGRARLVPADVTPPAEVPDADYPLVLTTGRMLEHWHTGSMTRRSRVLDALEPEAIASMNPYEIEKRGMRPGDPIRVSTRRGSIVATLRADQDVSDGMIFIPFCFNEAAANVLTNPQLDPFGKIPQFKFCAAQVDRVMQEAAE
jgi:formate dehydrogenase major subunit